MSSSAVGRSTLTAGDQPVPEHGTGWCGSAWWGAGSFDYWVTYSV
jgi:hypothetical protein